MNDLGTWQEKIIAEYKPTQTNADRIRSMTDGELGEFLGDVKRLFAWCGGPRKCVGRKSCRSCVMEWLEGEA